MISKRSQNLKSSIFSKYMDLISKREKEGIEFYKLNMGQPDFETNMLYFKSLSDFYAKTNSYSDPSGLSLLKESVCKFYNNLYRNITFVKEDIIITQGASDAIIKLLYSICDCNDEIIVLEPFFADYKLYCDMLNIQMKAISWDDVDDFIFKKKITNRTKAILFANPNNPDGAVVNQKFAYKLLELAEKYNLTIISDEVYSGLIYSDKYVSFIPYLRKNVVVVDSSSKKLNLCGSRIGYIISKNEELNKRLITLNDCRISISNAEQFAVANVLENASEIIEQSRNIYEKRINVIKEKLKNTKIKYITPYGGLMMLLEMPFATDKYVEWLINKYSNNNYSLLVTQASEFYISNIGKNRIRICVTIDDDKIEKIMNLLIESCDKYMEEQL